MFGLVVGVAAVSEKLRHAAGVSGSVTRFLFCHRTATHLATLHRTQNKYYVGEKKGPGATTCFDTGNTV